tara:strand:- start:21 stop:1055 length:1035 start_codon:yes stop_codon:yes gene_type:complete
MKPLRIYFKNFWGGFPAHSNIVTYALSINRNIEIIEEQKQALDCPPDIVFHNGHAKERAPGALNISWIIEHILSDRREIPDYNICDYSLNSCNFDDPRNHRLPWWSCQINWYAASYVDKLLEENPNTLFCNDNPSLESIHNIRLELRRDFSSIDSGRGPYSFIDLDDLYRSRTAENVTQRTRDCCSVASHGMGRRADFYPEISKHIEVIHAGKFLQNKNKDAPGMVGKNYREKITFLSNFKSHLCFENDNTDGWITEKILHAFCAGCLPIYWGPANIQKDFNEKAFINISSFSSNQEASVYIKEVINNNSMLSDYMTQPIFPNNQIPYHATPVALNDFFKKVGI